MLNTMAAMVRAENIMAMRNLMHLPAMVERVCDEYQFMLEVMDEPSDSRVFSVRRCRLGKKRATFVSNRKGQCVLDLQISAFSPNN